MDLLNAYVDESVHDDHGLYVIAAVLVRPSLRSHAESRLRTALPADRPPHWHIEDRSTRDKLVAITAALDIEARVYGCRFPHPRRKEAARARALTWFLHDLDLRIDEVVLDRREASQDGRDRRVLANLVPRHTRYRHAAVAAEPLLWVADIVAGAVSAGWLWAASHLETLRPVLSTCEREPG